MNIIESPRKKPTHIWLTKGCQDYITEKGQSSTVLRKLDIHMQKYETGALSYNIHNNQFKMN